jgi:hypothetical protein
LFNPFGVTASSVFVVRMNEFNGRLTVQLRHGETVAVGSGGLAECEKVGRLLSEYAGVPWHGQQAVQRAGMRYQKPINRSAASAPPAAETPEQP